MTEARRNVTRALAVVTVGSGLGLALGVTEGVVAAKSAINFELVLAPETL